MTTKPAGRLPFTPPFFYGWVVLGVCVVAAGVASTASNVFTSSMVLSITGELGWSRTDLTGVVTLATMLVGLAAPLFGRLVDRFGSRALMPVGALAFGAGMFIISAMDSLWQFYVGYILARAVGGAGLTGVVAQTAIVNWFIRMRGRTLGILSMALPLTQSVLVPVGQALVVLGGWRMVYQIMAVAALLLALVPALLFMRRRPEDVGLLPDGGEASAPAAGGQARRPRSREFSFRPREAARTPAFWLMVAGQFCAIVSSGAISFHLPLFWAEKGLPLAITAGTLSAFALAGGLSNGIWGVLSERMSERLLVMVVQTMAVGVCVAMLVFEGPVAALLLSAAYGVAGRGEGTLFNLLLANYFGRGHFGSISGLFQPFASVGLGLGPLLGSLGFDTTGGYQAAWMLFAALHLSTVLIMLLVRTPALPPRAQPPAAPALAAG